MIGFYNVIPAYTKLYVTDQVKRKLFTIIDDALQTIRHELVHEKLEAKRASRQYRACQKNQVNTITSKCVIQPKFLESIRNPKLTLSNSEGQDENSSIRIWSPLHSTTPCDEVTCIINCIYIL